MCKISDGVRSIYQYGYFAVRLVHRLLTYPIHSCFVLFIIYLQIMDVILYFQIRSRGPLPSMTSISNQTNSYLFDSLPVKKIMIGQTTQYVRSPLAECLEWKFHFTSHFPLISANSVSFLHCLLSLISIKFFASESLSRRRIGVLLFEFRSFLDCLDGVIFRAHSQTHHYKSYYGHFGYYVDAISDILGGICLMIGCLLYFWKHRPMRKSLQHVNRMILDLEEEPKGHVFLNLCFFALRYSLAAMFWDRTVRGYEQLLDVSMNKPQQTTLQLTILHSPLSVLIFYLWRYLSAITLQDYLLFAIFFDRTWDFIQRTNFVGWISLLVTIFLTELHLDQIRSLLSVL